jgi:protein SCO1/2
MRAHRNLWQVRRVAIRGRRLLLALLGVLAVAVGSIAIPTLACRPADPDLGPPLGTVPAFTLTDERGQTVTEANLRGHISFVNFIFTRCDAICPTQTMLMEKIQEKTFDVGDKLQIVSFSVDPEYDTPPRLAAYAKLYRADPARWQFLTGPLATIQSLVETTFMINMQHDGTTKSGAPSIAHQGFFLLLDGKLQIRGAYRTDDTQRLDEMIRDARFLARTGK